MHYSEGTVTSILKNDLGGITSMIGNVIRYRGEGALHQEIIFIEDKDGTNSRFEGTLVEGVYQLTFPFSYKNNWYHTFKNLSKMLPTGPGVVISNDVYELLMLGRFNTGKKVIQVVHDAYNINLALQHHEVVDAFICHSFFYYEVLCQLLSNRRGDIYHLPYGILLPELSRKENLDKPLRCLFLGRLHKSKGVYDLFEIEKILQEKDVKVQWTIMGRGPEFEGLQEQWTGKQNVNFVSPEDHSELIKICAANDVMVFPTTFEGFPVALVECMSVGCVPVVSDLPGGIREVVTKETGFLCDLKEIEQFAKAIIQLHRDRKNLEELSTNARTLTHQRYDARIQSVKYQELFKKILQDDCKPKHEAVNKDIGSRLDKHWIPDFVTRSFRNL